MKVQIRIHPLYRLTYVPKPLFEVLGTKAFAIINAKASVLFPADADYSDVLESLLIIQKDLEHRLRLQRKERGERDGT